MNSPRKPNPTYFGPRQRKPKGGFNTKPMMKIGEEYRKHKRNVQCMKLSKSNHMAYDLRVNVMTEGANTISPNDSNRPSSALIAKNSKLGYVLASKCASHPTTLRQGNLNPSSDFDCSEPSIVRNALPLKIPKASASRKSKDGQSHHIKISRATTCQTHLKAMPNLIHKAKNVATSTLNNGVLDSRQRGQSNSYKEEDTNVGKEGTITSELLKSREVSRKSNIPLVNRMDPNKDEPNKAKASQDEVVTKEDGMRAHTCKAHVACGNLHKETSTTNTNDASNLRPLFVGTKHMQGLESNLRENSSHLYRKNHPRHQRDDPSIEVNSGATFPSKHVPSCEYRETNLKLHSKVKSVGGNGKTNDVISRRRKQPLQEEKASTHVQKDLTCRPIKRQRYIEANEDEEGNVGDQHPVHIEDVTTELAPHVSISKHFIERQCYCCSKPIERPRWSGIFKIDGKEYISLARHLSSKSCEKVWRLSSLPKVVQVTKVPRMASWPKIFKTAKPTGDNIGLYFFPPEMRHDEELDQLVNEVMDKDLILRAVIGEAEMLIFPSVLLPEKYQTFRRKHYLWAAFKAKEDKADVIAEHEDEKEKHVSNQLDEVQSEEPDQEMILMKNAMLLENQQFPSKSIQEVEGCCVQGLANMWLDHEYPEERKLRDSSPRAVCTTATSTAVANAATVPTEATSFTTDNASLPANDGPIHPSTEAPSQISSVFGIVVRQAPNLEPEVEQFIQEMERKGALVTVMRGKAIGGDQWPSNVKTTMQ